MKQVAEEEAKQQNQQHVGKRKRNEQEEHVEAEMEKWSRYLIQLEENKKMLKKETHETVMKIYQKFKGDPKSLCELYTKWSIEMKEILEQALRLDWTSLPREMQELFPAASPPPFNLQVSRMAFDEEFHGNGFETLYEALNVIHHETLYARVAGLFQSSGWGKSRLVRELYRKQVWVVYLSLGSGTGYPQRSAFQFEPFVRKALGFGDADDQVRCMNYCLAFWICCIQVLADLVVPQRKSATTESWDPKKFVDMMMHGRGDVFWPKVEQLMQQQAAQLQVSGPEDRTTRMEFYSKWESVASALYTKQTVGPLKRLKMQRRGKLRLLFVIDEARELLPFHGRAESKVERPETAALAENIYIPLCRSTRVLDQSLVMFIDTTSKINNFLSPEWQDPSARHRNPKSGFVLAAPLACFFQGDIGEKSEATTEQVQNVASDQGQIGKSTTKLFKDVASDHAMVKYGRPIWWTHYRAALEEKTEMVAPEKKTESEEAIKTRAYKSVLDLATLKIAGNNNVRLLEKDEELIAIIGSRCGIDVDPSSQLVSDLVASHGMTSLYVTPDRNRLFAAWTVEPLVSEAAAAAMRVIREHHGYKFMLEPLVRKVSHGLINTGELGELVMRMILLTAIDNAREERAWCSVGELLKHLLGCSLEDLGPVAEYQREKVTQLLDGKILVNSFRRVYRKATELSVADIEKAFETRCAIVCYARTWGVDIYIPVHLGGEDAELNLTMLHVQVKLVKNGAIGIIPLAKVSPEFSGVNCLSRKPYLSLFVNLVGSGKAHLVQPHTVWESVVSSRSEVIKKAMHGLPDEVLETLKGKLPKKGERSAGSYGASEPLTAKEHEDSEEDEEADARERGGVQEQEDVEKNAEEEDANASETRGVQERECVEKNAGEKKVNESQERWRAWIQADWTDQIIVTASGLRAFSLDGQLRACLNDMLHLQDTSFSMHLSTKEFKGDERDFIGTRKLWELQEPWRNIMTGVLNMNSYVVRNE